MPVTCMDETSRVAGKRVWLHVICDDRTTLYRLGPHGAVWTEYTDTAVHDRLASYRPGTRPGPGSTSPVARCRPPSAWQPRTPGTRSWSRSWRTTRSCPRRPADAVHQQPGRVGSVLGQAANEDLGLLPHTDRSRVLRPHAGADRDRPPAGAGPARVPAARTGGAARPVPPFPHSRMARTGVPEQHCNEKSGWLFRRASPCVGMGGGCIAGRAALQEVQDPYQHRAPVPQPAAKQGQHGVQGLRHLVRGQAGLLFYASQPRSRKKCRSRHGVVWRCQPCQLRPRPGTVGAECIPWPARRTRPTSRGTMRPGCAGWATWGAQPQRPASGSRAPFGPAG